MPNSPNTNNIIINRETMSSRQDPVDEDIFYDSNPGSPGDLITTLDPAVQLSKRALLGELIGKNKDYEIRDTSALAFIKHIKEYSYNNAISAEHVSYLAREIQRTQMVIGNFTTVELDDGDIFLLDGHHRLTALRLLEPALLKNIPLTVFNYRSDSINSERTMDLFHKINKVKPYDINFEVNKDCLFIIQELKRRDKGFKTCLRDNKKTVLWPNYLEAKFKIKLEAKLKQLKKYNVERVIKQIIDFNKSLLNPDLVLNILFKAEITGSLQAKYATAKAHGFMLSLPAGEDWPDKIIG